MYKTVLVSGGIPRNVQAENYDLIADITVDPTLNTYELTDLKCGAAYKVQISGFTQTGEGVRSKACHVATYLCQGYTKQPIYSS